MSDCPHEKIDPAFTIRIWPEKRFVETILRGFWSAEIMQRFDAELRAMLPVLPAAGCPLGERITLYDLVAFQVQAQDVIAGLTRLATDGSIGSRRIALVVLPGLRKLQARRVSQGYGFFDTREAAMAWLEQA